MSDQDRTTEADTHATAILTAMLTAEDSGDPSELHTALASAAKGVPASMAVMALASLAATSVRLLAAREGVTWQQVLPRLGMASQLLRNLPGAPTDEQSR